MTAGAASAHVTLDTESAPANTDQTLTLSAPAEKLPAYNAKLIVEVPAGFTAKSCSSPSGFTCAIKKDTTNGRAALITWTRGSGYSILDKFTFVTHTPSKTGVYAFEANQYYTDGSEAHWDGAADSDHPAPRLTITPNGSAPVAAPSPTGHAAPVQATPTPTVTSTSTAAPSEAPSTTASPTATSSASTSPSAEPTASEAAATNESPVPILSVAPASDDSSSKLPVVLIALAVLLVAGLGAARLRQRTTKLPTE